MPYFVYKAKDQQNRVIKGLIQAASEEVAAEVLGAKDLMVLSLAERKVNFLADFLKKINRVKLKDMVVFSRQLSVVISASIPLVQGLRILIEQTNNELLRNIIIEVADDVEGGAKLSAALSRHPQAFSNFYLSIIKSGETSGKLDEVLNYLADQQEKDYDTVSKIRGAMIYPVFIFTAMVIIGILMMIVVVPQLTAVLKESGAELPLSTRILIAVSSFFTNFWWVIGLTVIACVAILKFFLKTENGRFRWDYFKLKLPIFGSLIQKVVIVRLTRSLNTLITGGVPLSKSLEIVADVSGSAVYHQLILETVKSVESGNPLASVFLKSEEIPPMVSQMLNLGEKTGRLDEILDKLASFYSREVNNTLANLSSLLEPLIMLVMGVAVGLLVAAIILPMYNLASAL